MMSGGSEHMIFLGIQGRARGVAIRPFYFARKRSISDAKVHRKCLYTFRCDECIIKLQKKLETGVINS